MENKYSIKAINDSLEEKIYVTDEKIGRIKKGDILVFNKNNDESIIKTMQLFNDNWSIYGKTVTIYNTCEDIKIENYLYASIMETDIPNDIYEDVISKKEEDEDIIGKYIIDNQMVVKHILKWDKYKRKVNNKKLYLKNGSVANEYNDLIDIKLESGQSDLLIVVCENINEITLNKIQNASGYPAIVLITNVNNMSKIKYINVRVVG